MNLTEQYSQYLNINCQSFYKSEKGLGAEVGKRQSPTFSGVLEGERVRRGAGGAVFTTLSSALLSILVDYIRTGHNLQVKRRAVPVTSL